MLQQMKLQQDQNKVDADQRLQNLQKELTLIRDSLGKVAAAPKKTKTVALVPPKATNCAQDYYHPFWSDGSSVVLVKTLIIVSIIVLLIVAFGAVFGWVSMMTKTKSQ